MYYNNGVLKLVNILNSVQVFLNFPFTPNIEHNKIETSPFKFVSTVNTLPSPPLIKWKVHKLCCILMHVNVWYFKYRYNVFYFCYVYFQGAFTLYRWTGVSHREVNFLPNWQGLAAMLKLQYSLLLVNTSSLLWYKKLKVKYVIILFKSYYK